MWIDDYQLADPPRAVNPFLQLQVLFGSGAQSFAWPWVFGWGFVMWLFIGLGGLDLATEARFLLTSVEETRGKITACADTNTEINDRTVVAFQFSYTDASGSQHMGTSYAQQNYSPAGTPVRVEYLAAAPDKARIEGMRLSTLPMFIVLFMGIFPAIGVILLLSGLRKGFRARRLLQQGRLGFASVLQQEATGTRINEQPVLKITYSYTDQDGRPQRFERKTHHTAAITDDVGGERVLYDSERPDDVCLLDELPGSGVVTPEGNFDLAGSATYGLKAPALTILVHGGIFVAWVAQGLL